MKFEYSIEIHAARETVWNFIQQPANRTLWDFRVADYKVSGAPAVNAAVEITLRWFPLYPVARATFVRFDPPHQSAIKIHSMSPPLFPAGGGTWILEECAAGTRFTTRFHLEAGRGVWRWVPGCWWRFWIGRDTRRALVRLKILLESTQANC